MTTKTLAEGLVAAQVAARAVEKDRRHDYHKYNYVSAEAMITEGRAALAAGDIALLTLGWAWQTLPTEYAEGDKKRTAPGRVVIQYELRHVSGDATAFESSSWVVPEKGRSIDKAESGAITENLSYTLRGLLLLPRVDEGTSVETRPEPEGAAAGPDPVVRELRRQIAEADDAGLMNVLDAIADAELAEIDEQDVLADVGCRGLDLAQSVGDVDRWVGAIARWKLKGQARLDTAAAYKRAVERLGA